MNKVRLHCSQAIATSFIKRISFMTPKRKINCVISNMRMGGMALVPAQHMYKIKNCLGALRER